MLFFVGYLLHTSIFSLAFWTGSREINMQQAFTLLRGFSYDDFILFLDTL